MRMNRLVSLAVLGTALVGLGACTHAKDALGLSVDERRPDWGRLRRVHADEAAQADWHAASAAFKTKPS